MNETRFWEMIESAFPSHRHLDEGLDSLTDHLKRLTREEVLAFQQCLNDVMVRAYTWDLIAAATFVGFGQSDDGFEDFRAWLVAQGRSTFEAIVANPTQLAALTYEDTPTEEWGFEALHMLPGEIAGEEDDENWPYLKDPDAPAGIRVSLSRATLQLRFPELWSRFGDQFMIVD